MNKISIIGIGPGCKEDMTLRAYNTLKAVDEIVGYTAYIKLLGPDFDNIKKTDTAMRQEKERCIYCIEQALTGKHIGLICSGDAGVYGMASLLYELLPDSKTLEIKVIPGVSAAISGAAILGAPLNHDFCTISLSDYLTPIEQIKKRLTEAAKADFVIVLYNPSSHKRPDYLQKGCELLLKLLPSDRPCGYVRNIGREKEESFVGTLEQLRDEQTDMFTTVFIGNSKSYIRDGRLITPRGYEI